ncbi:MAG: Xaa-Pro peptidase family protein [Eubacteriales bacterium]|nr:Xaa-Pro peptidase family protein [Eubacteriales bacterium]
MERMEALQRKLNGRAALVVSPVNRVYLTGFSSSAGALLVFADSWKLLVDGRYLEAAEQALPRGCAVLEENLWRQAEALCAAHGVRELAIEEADTSVAAYAAWQAATTLTLRQDAGLSEALSALRALKSPRELDSLRRAQRITDEAFAETLNHIRAGVSELDVRIVMGVEMAKRGCEKRAFDMILTSGERTSLPHGHPGLFTLQKGDFVMMDVGAKIDGYFADMTRTVAVGGVTEEQERVYDTVLRAQQTALGLLREGAVCREVDAAARAVIAAAGYDGCFNHGLGHSLGLEIHEQPRLNQTCDAVLRAGMMTTVEPGVYLPHRFGVRIEDMGAITRDGFENMTHSEKKLLIL